MRSDGKALSQADRARLLLNTPELANRWVKIASRRWPILHLGIGDLERFRAATVPLEDLYKKLGESELDLFSFLRIFRQDVLDLFGKSIPLAASIALGITEQEAKTLREPLGLFGAIISQWIHNQEIVQIQEIIPLPPDEDEIGNEGPQNPLNSAERMMSAYKAGYEEVLKRTAPQIYMLGASAAWSYYNIKKDNPGSGPKTKTVKPPVDVRKMSGKDYQEYMSQMIAGPTV